VILKSPFVIGRKLEKMITLTLNSSRVSGTIQLKVNLLNAEGTSAKSRRRNAEIALRSTTRRST
jgi:hypothetical protein